MLIKKIQFKNFKRFTDIEINLDPEKTGDLPKLVLLIGTNGSGKSSIFDGFESLNILTKQKVGLFYDVSGLISSDYYAKDGNEFEINIEFAKNYFNLKQIGNKSNTETDISPSYDNISSGNLFYGRTAFRYIPKITKTTIGTNTDTSKDEDRANKFIEHDTRRFENDLDTFVTAQFKAFNEANPNVKANFNKRFNEAFQRVFGLDNDISLQYLDFETPAEGKPFQFLFKKGNSSFNYDLMSAGEKMVFELLFNLYSRQNLYQDSIIFLDEIDLHLNTKLQKNLLQEITENWIPDGCQLWTASHSLGFIEYAREYHKGAIIDLDNLDFDKEQVLIPQKNDNLDIYEVSVPKSIVFDIFNDKKIILCENKNDEYYNFLGIDKTVFFGEKDKNSVIYNANGKLYGIIDRDYLTDEEILQIKKECPNLFVLGFYSFENYLYHPDNLEELKIENWDRQSYIEEIIKKKNNSKIEIGNSLSGRKSYTFFKNKSEQEVKGREKIIRSLNSDNFDDFYPYFDIKKYGKPNLNLSTEKLVSTNWFKNQIQNMIR